MDGERMSKSRGNTVDPDDLVSKYGADTVRLFLMFMGPWDQGGPWTTTGIEGINRFLRRVWALTLAPEHREPGDPESGTLPAGQDERAAEAAIRTAAHRALRDVTADYEAFHFNTMLAKLMELSNTLFRYRGSSVAAGAAWNEAVTMLLQMLAPAAPHISEELWSRRLAARGEAWTSIHQSRWPEVDPAAVAESTREVPVQVNGKVRDRVVVPADANAAAIEKAALASAKVQAILDGRTPDRIIQAGGGRLVNVVVR
jgi:leucyl-tRNA synthetase